MEKKFTQDNQSVPTPEKEQRIEHIPTKEEVLKIFEQLIGDKKYKTLTKKEDEGGLLCSWDIEIETEDGKTEYSFRRKLMANKKLPNLRIDVTFYDTEGNACGGHSVAKYDEEKKEWKLTP